MEGQSVNYTESDIKLVGRNKTFHHFLAQQRKRRKWKKWWQLVSSGGHKYASTGNEVLEEQWELKQWGGLNV